MTSDLTLNNSASHAVAWSRFFAIAALVLVVLGTKLIFIQTFGSGCPTGINGMLKQTTFTKLTSIRAFLWRRSLLPTTNIVS